ncbi:MAG: hypothetical protein ACYDAR_18960, partial [Thermomicrobiales bacterium]
LSLSLALLLRVLTHIPLRWMLASSGAVIIVGAFMVMLLVQPSLHPSFMPGQADPSPEIVAQRGWYQIQTDTTGERYVWTQERATIVFNFLVHTPLTISVEMRSAAVAGGPDAPVSLEVNGRVVGQLRPDPTNRNFQHLSVRFVPDDWGGHQTEVKLVTTAFKPGNGDPRLLGTMVQKVTVDKSEAWAGIGNPLWLVWALPFLVVLSAGLAGLARRRDAAIPGYAAIAACGIGALCAATIIVLMVRIGVVTPLVYQVWIVASSFAVACFTGAALTLPFGEPAAPNLARRMVPRLRALPTVHSAEARVTAIGASLHARIFADATRREVMRDLAFIFIIALGVRLVWVVMMPPWQATDETEHFAYANHIVEQHAIPHPPNDTAYAPLSAELRQSLQETDFFPLAENNRFYGKPESPLPVADYSAARTYAATGEARFDSGGARAA